MKHSRRKFIRLTAGAGLLSALTWRLFSPESEDAEFTPQSRRFMWQIDPDKCRWCGKCETACVRKPSAVKAVNDQKKCSNCVVCYGYITNHGVASDKIDTHGVRVCPVDAVKRKNFCGGVDGMFLYSQDHAKCVGCAACAKHCNEQGTASMFMVIRPDICLGCNECEIAKICPYDAIERVPANSVDDFRGEYGLEKMMNMPFFPGDMS